MYPRVLGIAMALSVLVSIAVAAGCSARSSTLEGTSWRLTGWTLSSLNPADHTITAKFSKGTISGDSGVNSYSGPVRIGPGDAFSVDQIAGTEMAGPELAMRAETAYLTLLRQAKSYRMSEGTLTLYDGGGNESLIFEGGANQLGTRPAAGVAAAKARHEAELMAIPGVTGVGIGTRAGADVIVVYVETQNASTNAQIPRTLDGFPVQVEVTGQIKAQ